MYTTSKTRPDDERQKIKRLCDRLFRRGQRDRRDAGQQPVQQQVDQVDGQDRGGRDRNLPHFDAAARRSGSLIVEFGRRVALVRDVNLRHGPVEQSLRLLLGVHTYGFAPFDQDQRIRIRLALFHADDQILVAGERIRLQLVGLELQRALPSRPCAPER